MSDKSKIEWTDATWSPTLGCTRVSEGCDGCYAIRTVHRMAHNPNLKVANAAAGLTERRDGRLDWTGTVNSLPDRLDKPLHWREPRRIFVDSQSDLFHDDVPAEFIARVFAVMALAPQHTFQVLTKRPGRMRSLLSRDGFSEQVASFAEDAATGAWRVRWPLRNVWLGVSVENQHWADIRIPVLLGTPASVRWLSCEPLLGPVDLSPWLDPSLLCLSGCEGLPTGSRPVCSVAYRQLGGTMGTIDWLVAGGESGPDARPMHPGWTRTLRDQCVAAGVPFHFKQWGEYGPVYPLGATSQWQWKHGVAVANDGTTYTYPDIAYPDGPRYGEALRAGHDRAGLTAMYRLGKMAAGRELDEVVWDEYPSAVTADA